MQKSLSFSILSSKDNKETQIHLYTANLENNLDDSSSSKQFDLHHWMLQGESDHHLATWNYLEDHQTNANHKLGYLDQSPHN